MSAINLLNVEYCPPEWGIRSIFGLLRGEVRNCQFVIKSWSQDGHSRRGSYTEQIITFGHRPFSRSKGHMSGQLIFCSYIMSVNNTPVADPGFLEGGFWSRAARAIF
jgi:hypothetical protein